MTINDVIELADARTKVPVLNCIKYIRQWLEIDVEVYDYDAGCLEFVDSLRKLENYIANEPFIDFETSVEEFERKTCEEMSLFLKEYK